VDVKELKSRRDVDGLIKVLTGFCKRRKNLLMTSFMDRMTRPPGTTHIFLKEERQAVVWTMDEAVAAAKALGELRDKKAVEPLIKAIHQPVELAQTAVVALGKIKDEKAIKPLTLAMKNYTLPIRTALREILGEKAVDHFIAILEGKFKGADDEATREMAIQALGGRKDEKAVEALIRTLKDQSEKLRTVAAFSLSGLRDRRAVEPLIQALSDENDRVRKNAALALGRIGDARAVEALIRTLNNKSEYSTIREYAAEALGRIGDERAVKPLTRALEEDNFYTRYAERALNQIKRRKRKRIQ